MFNGVSVVNGGVFTQFNDNRQLKTGLDSLKEATSPNAFHDSAERHDPSRCHPNTRVAIREQILDWVLTPKNDTESAFILWLNGPAGAGKSAIAQLIADLCFERELLLAAFFFSRFDTTRNHARSLIATIIYQVALFLPSFREAVAEAIGNDPLIFTRALPTQLSVLLIKPLRPIIASGYFNDPSSRHLILIDGLDECVSVEGQLDILKTIGAAFQGDHVPLLFLVASRPEHELKSTFSSESLKPISKILTLEEDPQSRSDVELFLRDKFNEIKRDHPFKHLIPAAWPSNEMIAHLVHKSSGHFIYASTVIKFIQTARQLPTSQLDIVLNLRSDDRVTPFKELDALYTHILASLEDPERALQILSFHLFHVVTRPDIPSHVLRYDRNAPSSRLSDQLLNPSSSLNDLEKLLSLNPGAIQIALCGLASILAVENNDETLVSDHESFGLKFFHASFVDFLYDKARARDFHLDGPLRHAEIAHWYFRYCRLSHTVNEDDFYWLVLHFEPALPTATLRADIIEFSFNSMQAILCGFDCRQPNYNLVAVRFLLAIKNSDMDKSRLLYARQLYKFAMTLDLRSHLDRRALSVVVFETELDSSSIR